MSVVSRWDHWDPTRNRRRALGGTVLFAVLAIVFANSISLFTLAQLSVLTSLLSFVALAQSWNILAGFAGQVSLGTSAFVGSGAYAAGLLMLHTDVGFGPAMAGATATGVVLAAVLALPLLRLRGDYFAVGTLAAALALQAWIINWDFAGGSTGISLPLSAAPTPVVVFQLSCLVAAVAMIAACLIRYSSFGNRLRAVRDNEAAAVGLGVSAFRHRLAALVISGGLAGLAGGLLAVQQISFEPTGMLGMGWTVNALVMTIVGGIGTVFGPAVGAIIVYYLLTEKLQDYETLSIVIEGALLVLVVRFAPQGVWALMVRGLRFLVGRLRPTS
ncbi:branched-chain amino acid ABC transporter permease [Nocardioides sp.]|uniref:branched-chain amino acid ABC transporter permease n=1 Tax=Nocardioides sp. TaxID=35761 RepID=UPI0039E29283